MSTVLVTGGSGFVGGHCVLALVAAGHTVRTTVRSLKREPQVRAMLKRGGAEPGDQLAVFAADLENDAGWADAVAGCDFVLHVASPFPSHELKDENLVIRPAVDGALRVLRASHGAGVKRVVMTSSFAAIGYGHAPRTAAFTEADWTKLAGISAYAKSKTLAERAAWDFVAGEGSGLELSVINPVGILGPLLAPESSTSIQLVSRLLDGSVPGCPRLYFGIVDVRDVADLHLRAMTDPAAKGERFLAVAGEPMSMLDIAKLLKARMGAAAAKVPVRELPDWLVRLVAVFDPSVRLVLPELGSVKHSSGEKARRLLGWTPRSNEEAVMATAESLVGLKAEG
jgi:nucleoside-diphosphate-sugar epimerase